MSRREPENVKRETPPDALSTLVKFPLDESQPDSPKGWSPSQVTKKVDERTPPEMQSITISNSHGFNIYFRDPKELPIVLPDGDRRCTASDDRPDGNSRRLTENREYKRHSATGRYKREEHSPSRSRQSRRLEHNRRDRSRSRNRSLSPCRRSHDTPTKENDPRKNSFRRQNNYLGQ